MSSIAECRSQKTDRQGREACKVIQVDDQYVERRRNRPLQKARYLNLPRSAQCAAYTSILGQIDFGC